MKLTEEQSEELLNNYPVILIKDEDDNFVLYKFHGKLEGNYYLIYEANKSLIAEEPTESQIRDYFKQKLLNTQYLGVKYNFVEVLINT